MEKNLQSTLIVALAVALLAGCLEPTNVSNAHTPAIYTLTYNGNGATSGTVPIDNKKYKYGDTVIVQGNIGNLAHSSNVFTGWAAEQTATEPQLTENSSFRIRRSLTLYAVWADASYTINFDKNDVGAGGSQASLSAVFGEAATLPTTTTFTAPPDKRFLGWAETSDGTVIEGSYTGPSSYSATVTLYAVWRGNPYTISFDKNDVRAGGSQASLSADFGEAAALPTTTTFTAPPNKRFLGWAETSDGTVIEGSYTGPSSYSATVTLYAVWADASYTINFDKNDVGAGGSQASLSAVFGEAAALPTTTTFTPPTDKRFLGWAETSDGTVIEGSYTGPSSYSATVTLYAVWRGKPYTITFDKNDVGAGGSQANLSAVFGEAAALPTTTTFTAPTDKRFLGWAETTDGTMIQGSYNGPSSYSATVTLYAVWESTGSAIDGNRNWQAIAMSSVGSKLAAVEYRGHLYTSTDSGVTWTNRGTAGSTIAGRKHWRAIAMSSDGSKLAAVEYRGHLYTSTDSGVTWTDRGTTGSTIAGNKKWQAIAMSSNGSKLAAVEYRGHLYTSTDSGVTWTDRGTAGSAIAGNKKWRAIAMSSDGSKLAAVEYRGHLYTSTDSGATWTDRSTAGSAIAGNKKWQAIAMSSDGSKLAAVVGDVLTYGGGHLYTSTDSGATWTDRSTTGSTIAGNKNWRAIAMSSDGSKLAAVEYRGHLYTSTDSGATWTDRSTTGSTIAGNKNWQAIAMSSVGSKLAAVEYSGHLYTSTDSGATWTDRSE